MDVIAHIKILINKNRELKSTATEINAGKFPTHFAPL